MMPFSDAKNLKPVDLKKISKKIETQKVSFFSFFSKKTHNIVKEICVIDRKEKK